MKKGILYIVHLPNNYKEIIEKENSWIDQIFCRDMINELMYHIDKLKENSYIWFKFNDVNDKDRMERFERIFFQVLDKFCIRTLDILPSDKIQIFNFSDEINLTFIDRIKEIQKL